MFVRVEIAPVSTWNPNPDDDSAHSWLLSWLRDDLNVQFSDAPLTNPTKGNLGESIALCIGVRLVHGTENIRSYAANGLNPLANISKPDIDIVWIAIGDVAEQDAAILQEVKTTSETTLSITQGLHRDHDKLFGEDVHLTLATRLHQIALKLKYESQRPDLLERVANLIGSAPNSCPGVSLAPTLVLDTTCDDPRNRLIALRDALAADGWPLDAINCWAIRLGDLDGRLQRLAGGS